MRISVALSHYGFSSSDIRWVIGVVLGNPPPRRKISRMARTNRDMLTRGRPPTIPKVYKRALRDLIAVTHLDPRAFNGNTLHFLHNIEIQFGLSPCQYLNWVARYVRRGGCMMRRCLLCRDLFPSLGSGERHCQHCSLTRRRMSRQVWEQGMIIHGSPHSTVWSWLPGI